jgi:hypothetical protein
MIGLENDFADGIWSYKSLDPKEDKTKQYEDAITLQFSEIVLGFEDWMLAPIHMVFHRV